MNNKITFPRQPKYRTAIKADWKEPKGKVGSNQHKRKTRDTWKAYLAIITFIGIIAWVLTMPIYAAEKPNETPVVKVSSDTVQKGISDPEREELDAKFKKMEAFMKTQVQINKLNVEWQRAQGIINLGIGNK